jgi:hypothetical protein
VRRRQRKFLHNFSSPTHQILNKTHFFPWISRDIKGDCTSNKRFSPPKPCNQCENFIKNGEENTDLSSLLVVLISK